MNIAVCCCVISVHGTEPRIHPYDDRKYSWLPLPVTVEEFCHFQDCASNTDHSYST